MAFVTTTKRKSMRSDRAMGMSFRAIGRRHEVGGTTARFHTHDVDLPIGHPKYHGAHRQLFDRAEAARLIHEQRMTFEAAGLELGVSGAGVWKGLRAAGLIEPCPRPLKRRSAVHGLPAASNGAGEE